MAATKFLDIAWRTSVALCASVTVVFGAFSLYGAYDMAQRKKERQRQQATFVAPPPNEEVLAEESTIRSDLLLVERNIGLISFKEHLRQKEAANANSNVGATA